MENSRFKFRAWNDEHKEMVYFDNKKASNDIYIASNILKLMADNSPFLMQYTGLSDKQGIEIYEGDIVKDLRSPFKDARSYSKVFYQEDRGRFVFGGWEIPAGMSHTFEVIGNIYEHSYLLDDN